jgi:hypothetical protein
MISDSLQWASRKSFFDCIVRPNGITRSCAERLVEYAFARASLHFVQCLRSSGLKILQYSQSFKGSNRIPVSPI